ncbi:type II toxin-antitoxin system VapC family toxin [Chitinimonas sp. BJB300]|uniref:type II toxin-antitoxin system VapC family toxin n=1 Tax=Chitinimonas sp. BJB300 TaxID=1559339 RepID=UPI000C1040C2|nr:type II toxin-antitoxin system VapC family toxin [Chitinimonas sp. BJB300]PHV10585.1 VapC toxin family PIN domain ribonuclease [Chitinimonas sp. BJB300]TSJ87499.1 type II toxin-antitoxin system VapC family toxin [Chitinimonas sp. BJB300]
MILVDTSVWIDHLRYRDVQLKLLLENGMVCVHPMVIGELACGNLKTRETVLDLLQSLPTVRCAENEEVLFFIEQRQLMGRGIGYIDAHLLASTLLEGSVRFWTRDKRLAAIATAFECAFSEPTH